VKISEAGIAKLPAVLLVSLVDPAGQGNAGHASFPLHIWSNGGPANNHVLIAHMVECSCAPVTADGAVVFCVIFAIQQTGIVHQDLVVYWLSLQVWCELLFAQKLPSTTALESPAICRT